MSRRSFHVGSKEIVIGWDKPLNRFFLDVYNLEAARDEDDLLYDYHIHGGVEKELTPELIVEILKGMGITRLPEGIIDHVIEDRHLNEVNTVRRYGVVEQ